MAAPRIEELDQKSGDRSSGVGSDVREVRYLVTFNGNKRVCDDEERRLRDQFLAFAETCSEYLHSYDIESGEVLEYRPRITDVKFSVESGERRRRCHVHAILVGEGRGKTVFDLRAIRRAFPGIYINIQYVRTAKPIDEVLSAYITKTKDTAAPPVDDTALSLADRLARLGLS